MDPVAVGVDAHPRTRINIGCGYDHRPGYLNVDMDPACEPDVLVTDNEFSTLPKRSFDEVLAKDVLEHIPRLETLRALLEWADLLKPKGRLIVQTASFLDIARNMASVDKYGPQHVWTIAAYGNQVHAGDFHHMTFTPLTLQVHLLAAGFDVERIWVQDEWVLHALATKARDWTDLLESMGEMPASAFIKGGYQAAFGRDADQAGYEFLMHALAEQRMTRRQVLRHLYGSHERLFVTADRHGL
jgi:predicted SAM-dependent methyltransferase